MPPEPPTVSATDANPVWGSDWPEVRDLWPLESTVAHLNHGSFGAAPTSVLAEQQSWRERMESNPNRFFRREAAAALEEAREEVGAFFGAEPGSVVFVDSVTAGANTVIASFPLGPGDVVLLTDHSYGAVRIAAERVCADRGAAVETVHVPLDADEAAVTELVLAAVHSRTRLVVLDHVTSATARQLSVAALVPAVQERGAAVLVDGAHALAMLDVDLTGLGADFYLGALHKWCCGPRGSAILHVPGHRQAMVRPLVASWGEGEGFPRSFDEAANSDPSGWLAAPRALRHLDGLGLARLREHNVALAIAGQQVVADALGLGADTLPRDPELSIQLVPLPAGVASTPADASALQDRLGTESSVEVAVTSWDGRGFVRVSAQAYNAPADYERLAAELPGLL